MRRFIAFAAVLLFAQSSQAVTLYTKLQDLTGGTPPGVHSIGIYIQTDPNSTADDFGFSGAQFDVIAQDTNSNYTGTISTTGTQVGAFGYSKINPSKVDATTTNESVAFMMPQPVTGLNNGNLDAVGFSVFTVPGSVIPYDPGALGQSGGWELVGKEAWSTTNFDVIGGLKLYLTGAQYFDPSDPNGNTFKNYDAVVFVPEPSSLVLVLLGSAGLATLSLRRQIAKPGAMAAKLLVIAEVCLATSAASAATITVRLQDLTGGLSPGVHSIGIYLKTDAATSTNGFSGAQIDILSLGTGHAAYVGPTSTVGTNIGIYGYSKINPSAVDATSGSGGNEQVSAMLPQPVNGLNDGDIDAVGFSIYCIPGNVDPVNGGAVGQTGTFEYVGKEAWNFTSGDTLMAYLTGAQYFADDTGNTFANYDAVVSIPVALPEPGSILLMSLGGLAAIYFARRKVVC